MYGISIIICSKNGFLEDELVENIKTTIGSEYEIIVIDNSKNKYSIFEAYNIGIKNSIFPYLLFVHEDVLFHSQSWGEILISYFNNDLKLGLIGIAGSKTKEKIPSTWLTLIHISEPTRQTEISYAVFCMKKKNVFLLKRWEER